MNFGEKKAEYSQKHGKDIPVWQSPKYLESKAKAEEIIESGKYGLKESDFWILMNVTKSDKMAYTGLIISHNGCLKINDHLESKFDPACVSMDKDGYKGSLVYTYCNPEQGIYEVGEVSPSNCKNDYPYAMAYKRMFDRVVLKLSKLAYAGIYSDSEADEFSQRIEAPEESKLDNLAQKHPDVVKYADGKKDMTDMLFCERCHKEIIPVEIDGVKYSAEKVARNSRKLYGHDWCYACQKSRKALDEQEGAR